MADQPPNAPVEFHAVTGIDAAFLHTETPSTHWHVIGVSLVDDSVAPEPFDAELLRRVLAERIGDVEVLRRRPVGTAAPHWVHDEDVDLDEHVTSASLPPGSGLGELAALAGEIGSTPLRRDRPLWEFTVVDGLADGRKAIIGKIHHSLVDGVAAVGVLGAIFTAEPTVPPSRAEQAKAFGSGPPRRDYLAAAARSVADQPAQVARSFTRIVRSVWRVLQHLREPESTATLPLTAPRMSLSRSITPRRSAAFATISIDDVKEVRRAFGVTFNDVAMAVAAGAIREWLAAAGDLPDRPLVASIPTSVRTEEGATSGNEVSTLFGALPTHVAEPAERVRFLADEMPTAKAFLDEIGPDALPTLALVAPWNLAALLFRAYSDLGLASRLPPAVNLVLTSVPGPPVPLYCGGARMDALFPLGPIFDGAALNVSVVSYTDKVCFGFFSCPDVCPPIEQLADEIPTAIAALVACARSIHLDSRKDLAMDVQERNRRALDAVQERRDEYYEAVLGLERAIALAAGDDPAAWASQAVMASEAMAQVLRDHVAETEAPGSFYDDVVERSPNLAKAAERLRSEHEPLQHTLDALTAELRTVGDDADVDTARQAALDVIKQLLAHRHRGADLVYDAYNVDVATGD